jgi:hypothetical protein
VWVRSQGEHSDWSVAVAQDDWSPFIVPFHLNFSENVQYQEVRGSLEVFIQDDNFACGSVWV